MTWGIFPVFRGTPHYLSDKTTSFNPLGAIPMKTHEILARVASGQLTSQEGAKLIAARKRLHEPSQTPMSLQELRLLLEGMEGKIVRGGLVSCASVAVEVNTVQFSVVVSHAVPGRLQGETAQDALLRIISGQSYSACVCDTEDELRAVLQDPSKGNWYVSDELQP